ncbi:hypothetical protein EA462_12405 [Natrarchaeobius halalkaliphilus]|uniref:Uncharacterized protein n=1 Tax=Natrarchaeobius halalkaliphilus TaxID=1679091 RepID=A0A3N6MUT4_9EURY|nr:DUF5783 family protein [Natrarchaeobius halalkaliphilus]RQG89162.1 hypothetical protein EA462_12405 [Natrarchaeobius halalkaliphilus]
MADFDPEKFDDKYANYFPELQQAYKNAFNRMNDRYDSKLIHAIDQQVLNESEPFYEGHAERSTGEGNGTEPGDDEGEFRIDLPEDPYDRISGVVVEKNRFEEVLEIYVDEIKAELRRVFGFV